MKRETLRHPKTYDLAARLKCSRPEALGFLTLLWDFCSESAPAGDIGKWPDGAIARGCDWPGDPAEFVLALVDSSWLDRSETYRLVIHDIHIHAEQWWRQKLTKLGMRFVTEAVAPTVSTVEGTEIKSVASTVRTASRDRTEPLPSSVICLPLSEALPEKIKEQIPADWFTTTSEPLQFAGADGSEASVFEPISREEMLADPKAMADWWRYQLGCPAPVLGREAVWCLLSLALGLKFANPKCKKWKSRIGIWANAISHGFWPQAGPYLDRAEKLLRPIIFTEAK